MVIKKVEIGQELSNYVERLSFEYNSLQNILKFLLSKEKVNKEYLKDYMEDAVEKGKELELAKTEIANKFTPTKNPFNFGFLFEEASIVYRYEE